MRLILKEMIVELKNKSNDRGWNMKYNIRSQDSAMEENIKS